MKVFLFLNHFCDLYQPGLAQMNCYLLIMGSPMRRTVTVFFGYNIFSDLSPLDLVQMNTYHGVLSF